jgi:hypothetical protein
MRHTWLEELSPVSFKGPGEVVRCEPPRLLGKQPGKPFVDSPALFWRHDVAVRPGTELLAFAGDAPVAFRRTFGKGIVVAFSGTALGKPAKGERPFWQSDSWRDLFDEFLRR